MEAGKLPAAFFTSTEITQREVKLGDGSTHMLPFREASAKAWRRYWVALAEVRENDDEFEKACAQLIAASVVDPDGSPAMTVDQAMTLTFEAQQSIIGAMRVPPKEAPGNG